MSRPLLLDLFCGAGGAAVGYHRAGFDVVGVDLHPQPRYPFPFIQDDALRFLLAGHGEDYDAIHASPPCQHASSLRRIHKGRQYPALIEPTREMLTVTDKPYVIENVEGSDLDRPTILCGSMFGLGATVNGSWHQLRRHRCFECSFLLLTQPCRHVGKPVGVYGGTCANRLKVAAGVRTKGMTGSKAECREAMGVGWMMHKELTEAIPPAYTEFVGRQLIEVIR